MDDLKTIYRQALAGRIDALEAARGEADSATAVRRIAHSLRGSGGTYGFPEVSAAAGAVEEATDAELDARIDALLVTLRSVARGGEARAVHILIVDDDPEIRLLAGFLLRNAGHVVTEAATADEARTAAAEDALDVVLMDVMLGEDDGVAVAASLPVAPSHVIFLTGATRPEQVARINDAGAAGIIHKPFDPSVFVERIAELTAVLRT